MQKNACSWKHWPNTGFGTVSGKSSFIIHLYACWGRERLVSSFINNLGGGNEAGHSCCWESCLGQRLRINFWCLTTYPSLSKLVVAEAAQLLSCPSEQLPVILLCRPRGSSDGSKRQMLSWRSLCHSSLSCRCLCEKQAPWAGISSSFSGWGAYRVTLTAPRGQAPRGCDSAPLLERYS